MKSQKEPQFKWDKWQKEVLETDGNITIRSGRQVGKSEVIGAKGCKFAIDNPGTTTLIIAASQRQSSLIFEKVKANVDRICEKEGDIYKEPPTLTKIWLKNGSKIYSLPAGRTGYFIRGFSIDLLIADEAAYIPEIVWNAVIPMIAVSKKVRGMGFIILLSTPFGRGGYYFHSFTDPDFKSFHISSEDCRRIPTDFLRKERQRMTKAEYRQEYLGEFTDEWNQFFPTELIKKCMTFIEWNLKDDHIEGSNYYYGLDPARYGGDEIGGIVVSEKDKRLKAVKCTVADRVSTTDTVGRTGKLDDVFHFKKLFIDDAGIGGAVTDQLMELLGKRRVMGLNNASKRVEVQGEERKRGILKEDLYSNTLMLMETGKLELISDLKLLKSMKSIIYEYTSEKNLILSGNYSHLTEALVRACWCLKERGLNLYVY